MSKVSLALGWTCARTIVLIPKLIARERAQKLRDTIRHHLSDNRRGEIMRTGIRLAIFGPPNAGKSSLLNFLGACTR